MEWNVPNFTPGISANVFRFPADVALSRMSPQQDHWGQAIRRKQIDRAYKKQPLMQYRGPALPLHALLC